METKSQQEGGAGRLHSTGLVAVGMLVSAAKLAVAHINATGRWDVVMPRERTLHRRLQ